MNIPHEHHAYISEYDVRCKKVESLEQEKIFAWPDAVPATLTAAQARCLEESERAQSYTLAGRIMSKREHGKSIFLTLRDYTGTIQLYVKADEGLQICFQFIKNFIETGDHLSATGSFFVTKTGELTLKVSDATLLSKCLHGLPEKFSDIEQRYRQRSVDLIVNTEVRERFIIRSRIIQALRRYLDTLCFLEVETPMLHPIPGGAAAQPFVTHHNALKTDLFLRIAPELYLKRLVVGGFERVYEINRNFRNEGISTRHNPEFTMLELYMAHYDYQYGMQLLEDMFRSVLAPLSQTLCFTYGEHTIDFSRPFERLTPQEAILKYSSLTASHLEPSQIDSTLRDHKISHTSSWSLNQKVFALFEHVAERNLIQPTFIINFPIELSPLSKRLPGNPDLAARFELFIGGMEISNGFNELNDPFDQAARFNEQAEIRSAGNPEAMYFDKDYINALEYGLPPTVGIGIGIDRLVMLATNTATIKDVILFPTMKPIEKA